MFPFLVVGGLALGFFFWSTMRDGADSRVMNLVRGKRYAIVHRVRGPGWDASMYPGFCNFSTPVVTGQGSTRGGAWTEVQFTAEWCAANMRWDVPADVAIAEV